MYNTILLYNIILKTKNMKVRASLKSAKKRDKDCQVIKRGKKILVINKKNPRFKAKQG
jgi:large subunit ribosomal protein L36